ncbi:RNA polymerase sigma-70 factor, ECF subfamily [Fodinibius roseus]|uniref:RNA polymerase sigma-70 factor, ECF subfamily n=1 Tax=Fodinibius roseus TaxID=1194090 RepID=A0A1M5CLM9_9BACT|nr:RNA polymerase sigma-70 factor [Fodinibius roseus]SHF55609.1 RNA polymerase sigma-70 factor, ECF subfamily [Fodinibius roseus]
MEGGNDITYDSDQHLVERIREGDEQAFKRLFFNYYYDLCGFASQMTASREQAKDIVQEVFYKVWKGREQWTIYSSLKAYLFQSVRNETLNQMDREQHRQQLREQIATREKGYGRELRSRREDDTENEELLNRIWSLVGEMPRRRRAVFVLHRKHGLSYNEIAEVMGISRKTVENHMGLALSHIREQIEINHD